MAKAQTPPLFMHLHDYALETAAVISAIEHMQAFAAGEMAGVLLSRTYATVPAAEIRDTLMAASA